MYLIFAIDNQIKSFLEMQYTTINNENTINSDKKKVYFKLPYIGPFQRQPKSSLNKFVISIAKTLIL